MKAINDVVQYILNLGPTVMLPIMILIIALIFRVPFGKALRSGLTIGIGFVGINLVIGVLSDNLGPAAQAMVERFGFHLTVIDTGWPSAASAAWASPVSAVLIPICLIVNVILLLLKVTKTLDIDLWNYWHFIAAGATGYIVTNGNWWFAILCAVLYEIACLIIADKTAPLVAKFYGLEGVSLPTGSTVAFGLVGIPMVKILMEGLIPISESVRDFLQERYGEREIYLGLDAAVTTGHPANLATGLLLVPITLFIAVILPGNKVLPFGDLATIPFYVSLIVAHRKGNIIQSVLTGTVVIALALYMATNFAPVHTEMMRGVYEFPKGATQVSTLDMGGNFLNWVILKFSQLVSGIL